MSEKIRMWSHGKRLLSPHEDKQPYKPTVEKDRLLTIPLYAIEYVGYT